MNMPEFVGVATLGIGAALVASPRLITGPLGLSGQDAAVRALGVSDLVLVPGLLRGEPRWPWMAARAGLNVVVATYLLGVAGQSTAPRATRGFAAVMLALTAADGVTARTLR